MKFIKIATISFLAGNAAVAAAHSHIPAKKCKKAAKDLHMCVLKVIADDATGAKASAWENVITEAEGCYTAAGDDKAAQEACAMPVLELSAEDCPSGFDALLKACAPTSFEFEDFVLDLAEELEFESFAEELAEEIAEEISEELEGAAFWEEEEDEFITTTKKSKTDINSADINSEECDEAFRDLQSCLMKAIYMPKDPAIVAEWRKVESEAEACYESAEDEAAQEACREPYEALLIRDCPDDFEAFTKACGGFEDFALDLAEELESTAYVYGLRGSTIEE